MEIQGQMSVNVTSSGSSSAGAGTAGAGLSNSTSGQASGGFSAALVGMLTATSASEGAAAQALTPGLNALIQQLGNASNASQQPSMVSEDALKQLDALIDLLNSTSEDAASLLQSPDVQAWLAQIQALLMQQAQPQQVTPQSGGAGEDSNAELLLTPADESANTGKQSVAAQALFIPLEVETVAEQQPIIAVEQVLKPISKQEAKDILKDFKQLLTSGRDQAAAPVQTNTQTLQHLVAGLKQIVNSHNVLVQPIQENQLQQATAAPSVNANLEILAAKTAPLKVEAPQETNDGPLFEPLVDLSEATPDSRAIPMHEYLKQVSTGTHAAKAPVLLMQAPTFTEDMSQFVMKSFTVNAIAEGISEAKLSLYPQHLGQVDVKLTMHNGQLVAQFVAESVAGKEMLESQMSQLRATLQNQGIQVDKLEVTQSPSLQSGLFQEQRQQQQQFAKQQKNNNTNKAVSLEEELEQEAKTAAQILSGMGRTSIDVTA